MLSGAQAEAQRAALLLNGEMKARCPECGYITTLGGFDRVCAYVCDACSNGTRIDNSALPAEKSPDTETDESL